MDLHSMPCATEDQLTIIGLGMTVGLALVVSLALWFFVVRAGLWKARTFRLAIAAGFVFAVGGVLATSLVRRLGGDAQFESYRIDHGTLSLVMPWPRRDVEVPMEAVTDLTVERGLSYARFRASAVSSAVVWLHLTANGQPYGSCRTVHVQEATAAGSALAAAAGKQAEWRVHCLGDGRELPSSKAAVLNDTTDVVALCDATR